MRLIGEMDYLKICREKENMERLEAIQKTDAMEQIELFTVKDGRKEAAAAAAIAWKKELPWISIILMTFILAGCLGADIICGNLPSYLDLEHCSEAPGRAFLFGTDTLGRDLFACIWYGGRISIGIGFLSAFLSAVIAICYGSICGFLPKWMDAFLMRLADLILSIPGLLLTLFLLGIFGKPTVWSISVIIGATSWCAMAKIIRTEVRQLRNCEYVLSAKCMGGGFFYILRKHLAPNYLPSILFMVVMNIRSAIAVESTLSFMGMGLPLEIVSWGSLLSLANQALLTDAWWIIVIPGGFLVTLLMSVTSIGNWLRG